MDVKKYKDFDWILLSSTILIFVFGLMALFSATYPHRAEYALRQLSWFLLGGLILIIMVKLNYRQVVGLGSIFYFLALFLLIAVFIFGSKRMGAQRWIAIGVLNIQPSEFAKLFITIALVQYMSSQKVFHRLRHIFVPFIIVGIPFFLIVVQPDLGTGLMLIPIALILLYAWGTPLRYIIFVFAGGLLLSPLGWFLLKDYQRDRLMVFMNPGIDPLGAGYTIIQSKIAIGSGELLGKGWMSGTQNQLNFLAERHTDFIFSVVGEEWGLIGGLVLLCLYFVIVYRALIIAEKTDDPAGRLLAVGIAALIGIQVLINVCMTMGFMPVVGLPLPLVSYGGSSLLVTLMAIGLLESIAIHR